MIIWSYLAASATIGALRHLEQDLPRYDAS
jgi:hypothetical protein